MSEYIIQGETLTKIADVVRTKTGTTGALSLKNLEATVSSLPVAKEGVTWNEFDEEGWVTKATLHTSGIKIPNETFRSTTDTGGHHGVYCRLTEIDLPSQITSIGEYAFAYCYLLSSFDFSNIEEIGKNAFMGCENLVLNKFPSKLKKLNQNVFSDCPKVSFTELPNGIIYEASACSSMTGLTHIKMPSEWTAVPYNCFTGCENLVSVEFPPNITSLGPWCFSACKKLALTELPSTLITISERAFWNTPKLAITKIPASVQTIGKWAFQGCALMTELTFEGTPTSLDAAVFYNCNNLTTINVPWAEGAVANAPWGATKATINYNYTGA